MRDDTRNGCNRRRMGSGSLVGILGKVWLLNRQREPAKKASGTIYCLKNFGAIKKGAVYRVNSREDFPMKSGGAYAFVSLTS